LKIQQASACLLAVAMLVAGCGGGGSSTQGTCSLGGGPGCGGTLPPDSPAQPPAPPGTSDPAATVGALELVASNIELGSAGLAGGEVTLTALVKTAGNVAVSGARVEFSADSGFLAVINPTTDASGKASARLGTGGSKANRAIKITAKAGAHSTTAVVNVTGTHILFSAPSTMTIGSNTALTATLLDSADRPVAGQALSVSARNGNPVTAGAATDANGQVGVKVSATKGGAEDVTVSALGASVTKAIMVGGNAVSLTPGMTLDASGAEVPGEVATSSCVPIDGSTSTAAASVTLSASRGTLYSDAACSRQLSGALAVSAGAFPRVYISSENAGQSTIEAMLSNGGVGTTRLEFVAPLLSSARVSLQSEAAVVGSGERSTLIAVVRDGTSANNLVKGATVQFSIVADPSGGNLLSPFSAVTGSDGVARAVFVAGPNDGGKDGTMVQARIPGLPYSSALTSLTVNKKALSIQFGTGNTVLLFSPSVFQKDFTVFVSDSAGNPVKDVAISVAAWATRYMKGWFSYQADDPTKGNIPGHWEQTVTMACANEDIQRKGLYETAFDTNGNGMLEPGIPLTVSVSGKTDAMGLALISLRYPRDRSGWIETELTVTGTVAGTESVARSTLVLPGLGADYTDPNVAPPGKFSPYGTAPSCSVSH
jgi:hypothetical protein